MAWLVGSWTPEYRTFISVQETVVLVGARKLSHAWLTTKVMLETRAALPSFLSAHSTHSCVNVNTQLIMLLSSVCNQALSGPIESLSNPRQLSLPDLWPVYMTRLTQSYSHGNHFLYFSAARASPCQSSKLTKKKMVPMVTYKFQVLGFQWKYNFLWSFVLWLWFLWFLSFLISFLMITQWE